MKLLIPILLVYSLPVGQALALQIRNYSSARHDRFTGFSSAPVANASFMHGGVDLTGVGWDSTYVLRQFTLVSPRHFVGANHFRPPIGAAIRFVSADGTVRSSTVQSLSTIPNAGGQATDLLVGRLSTPFLPASGVRFLPCHLLDTEAAYIGQTLGVLGATGPRRARHHCRFRGFWRRSHHRWIRDQHHPNDAVHLFQPYRLR